MKMYTFSSRYNVTFLGTVHSHVNHGLTDVQSKVTLHCYLCAQDNRNKTQCLYEQ